VDLNFKEKPISFQCAKVIDLLWEDRETLMDEIDRLQLTIDQYQWAMGFGEEENGRRR
jgi:hypothetical protein